MGTLRFIKSWPRFLAQSKATLRVRSAFQLGLQPAHLWVCLRSGGALFASDPGHQSPPRWFFLEGPHLQIHKNVCHGQNTPLLAVSIGVIDHEDFPQTAS